MRLKCRGCVVCAATEVGYPLDSVMLNYDQLWNSVMISFCCKKEFFDDMSKLYLYVRIRIIECYWEYCVFKKMVVEISPLNSRTIPASKRMAWSLF